MLPSKGLSLMYIFSKLYISISIKWCRGIIHNRADNISNVPMFLNPETASDVIWLEELELA